MLGMLTVVVTKRWEIDDMYLGMCLHWCVKILTGNRLPGHGG